MKWFFASLVSFVLTVALLELSLPLLHKRYAVYFRRRITGSHLNVDDARRFVRSKKFDPELGWDKDPVAQNYVAATRYFAQSYGDSFVESNQDGPENTWQAHFQRLTGEAILNLGVGGYGLDQAVLKFEKYARQYRTHIAILGLYNQTFRRALSYHSFYYFDNADAFTFAFKPIFVKRDEEFELIRPPCEDAKCLMEVLSNPDHNVWRVLARYDYWYQANQKKSAPGFPNTIKYVHVLPEMLRTQLGQRPTENYFFVNAGALEVVEYLIERFVNDSRNMGMTPVCVMLYSSRDLEAIKGGMRPDESLLKFLAARGIPYVDTAQYILNQYRQDDGFKGLSLADGHLNRQGNLMVAEALARALAPIGLLKH